VGGGLLMGLIEGQGIACEPPAAPTIVQAARAAGMAVGGLVALAVGTG
jgi:hypothetical protein